MKTVEDLFRRHSAEVLAYALRRADRATAEDVVSEVFLIAGRRHRDIPPEEPVLWLYGVARRVLANHWRSVARRDAMQRAVGVLLRDRVEPSADDRSPLLMALAELRPADREVLMLTAWEGLDSTEAAVVLDCSPVAVRARLSRARVRLRDALERHAELVR